MASCDRQDLACVINTALRSLPNMKRGNCDRCVICCRDLVAGRAVEVVAAGLVQAVCSVVVLSPNLLPSEGLSAITFPILVIAAEDDEHHATIQRIEAWQDFLQRQRSVASLRTVPTGGHNIAKMLEADANLGHALRDFIVSSLFLKEIGQSASEVDASGAMKPESLPANSVPSSVARIGRLWDELPDFIQKTSPLGDDVDAKNPDSVASMKRLSVQVQSWMAGGLVTASE